MFRYISCLKLLWGHHSAGKCLTTNLNFTPNDNDATCTIYSWWSTPKNVDNAVDESIIDNIDSITEPLEISNPSSAGLVYIKGSALCHCSKHTFGGFFIGCKWHRIMVCQSHWKWPCTWIHLPLDKMATILQTTISNAYPWMKNFVFCFEIHRRSGDKPMNADTVHYRICAALGWYELTNVSGAFSRWLCAVWNFRWTLSDTQL